MAFSLGHASFSKVNQLVSTGLLGSISNKSFDYMPCQFGKQTGLTFNNSVSHALSPFDLIHYVVWGPSPITTQGGSRYLLFLWMIFPDILGFISSKIILNFIKHIVTLPK